MNHKSESALTGPAIVKALQSLSDLLGAQGVTGELCLFGGTVMVLSYQARVATRDVDALFQPTAQIRAAAARIASDQGLPQHWLNDGVKRYISNQHRTTPGNLPQFPHLKLTMPVPEYLLAMKCMAARLGGPENEQSDIPDIIFLIKHLGLTSPEQVLDIVSQYYPASRISVKTQYVVEGLFEEGKV